MPAIKIRVPKKDRPHYGDGPLSVSLKGELAKALASLEQHAAPRVPSLSMPCDSLTIWISDEQMRQVEALANTHQIEGVGPAASGLLHAAFNPGDGGLEEVRPGQATTTLDRINQALGDGYRPDQAKFFQGISTELSIKRPINEVIFAEASTGVGKTRGFLAAVLDWVSVHPDDHAVIALPSYAVLLQTVKQWLRIGEVYSLPCHEVLVGMQEFVSAHALERVLREHPDEDGADRARAWLASGGASSTDDALGHRWLMRSLQEATGHAWKLMHEVQLDTDTTETDPGMKTYRGQFTSGRQSRVLFCTHAMLAVDVRLHTLHATRQYAEKYDESAASSAWKAWQSFEEEDRRTSRTWEIRNDYLRDLVADDAGRLPPIGLLVVDEAHLLEQQFAAAFTSGMSLSRLVSDLRLLHGDLPKLVLARDLAALESCRQVLRTFGQESGVERQSVVGAGALRGALKDLTDTLQNIMNRAKASKALAGRLLGRSEFRKLRVFKAALDVAARASGERSGMRVQVSWSPSYQWPSIVVGRYDVSRELDFLWSIMVKDRSVVVSATLYEDLSRSGLESMRRILSVREASIRPIPPIRPIWLYEPVMLHVVSKEHRLHADNLPRFRRPTHSDNLDSILFKEWQERWRSDITRYVAQTYATSAGGILLLLTSHAERHALSDMLADVISKDCLLSQSEGTSLDKLRHTFLERVAEGKKPLLMGVGSAWTGLDISGDGLAALTGHPVPASHDNVLTDLIIPVAPIGMNRSLTHEWRRERQGMPAEIGMTAIMMRQGIGRLVRREGIPNNRRLHVLDARIHESKWTALLRPVATTLTQYKRRKEV
jgi:CRISPR type IV-associated DEAD/DEAH-box helicase Csf4